LKTLKTLQTRWLVLIVGLIAIVIAACIAIYYLFLYSPYLSRPETANRIENVYNRANVILSFLGDDIRALAAGNITLATFTGRVASRTTDMTNLHLEVIELRAAADPAFLTSIDYLERGLQSYVTALNYAANVDLPSTTQYLEEGTSYINQSRDALPTF
jgi:hypothetical protein